VSVADAPPSRDVTVSAGGGGDGHVTTINLNADSDLATGMPVPPPWSMLVPPPSSLEPEPDARATSVAFTVAAPRVVSVGFDRALEELRSSETEQQVSAALLQLSQLSCVALHTWPSDARTQLIDTSAAVRLDRPATWTGDVAAAFGLLLRKL
jgi:hypothetical protein